MKPDTLAGNAPEADPEAVAAPVAGRVRASQGGEQNGAGDDAALEQGPGERVEVGRGRHEPAATGGVERRVVVSHVERSRVTADVRDA